jgi:hypothetical protein
MRIAPRQGDSRPGPREDSAPFDPYEALNERSAGRLDAEGWSRRCAELGIGALPIVIPPAPERRKQDA